MIQVNVYMPILCASLPSNIPEELRRGCLPDRGLQLESIYIVKIREEKLR